MTNLGRLAYNRVFSAPAAPAAPAAAVEEEEEEDAMLS
jgi:hypothetical protein